MGSEIYRLEGLQVAYGGRIVLDIESLSVRHGEVLAVVGPSGAGKSTLLRQLGFLEFPHRGQLFFDGEPAGPGTELERRRRVTAVFQNPVMLRRSVLGNIGFGPALRGEAAAPAELADWAERMGLGDVRHADARSLSAGEAQRAALARALIVRPDVLLLDEPTANLDPANVALIERIVMEEHARRGTTIVMVTHNIFQARRLAERTALLLGGRLVETAPTEQFFEAPGEAVTAAFLRGEFVY
ncbi:MAG TPA: ATP-binding cassette domain-containing protein [Anaerolineales bacterium]|nr:ATP-binding cassette domain-containing protein [Anaerolineales bacterium]